MRSSWHNAGPERRPNQAFCRIFFMLHHATFVPLSPLDSVRWFCAIHSPCTHTVPQSNQVSAGRASALRHIVPALPGWLLVVMVESAPRLSDHHGSLSCAWVTRRAPYSMRSKHSNPNIALRITMLCGNMTARHNWYKHDPLDFFSEYFKTSSSSLPGFPRQGFAPSVLPTANSFYPAARCCCKQVSKPLMAEAISC